MAYRLLIDVLRARARESPSRRAFTFLFDGVTEADHVTYSQLDRRAREIAVSLQQLGARGERALLLYPPGLDYIAAFLGCLYAGTIAVPAYPPRRRRPEARLGSIVRNAGPRVVLGPESLRAREGALIERMPELGSADWLATDSLTPENSEAWQEPLLDAKSPAFLQYTSGSTADPKGVQVSHGNLMHNEEMIRRAFELSEDSVIVGWLPLYHDMGLIGNVLQTIYAGANCVLMSPMSFLAKPLRWLEAISRYRATTSGGPSFAYELCARKISDQARKSLDLSSWKVAFNGAEPVRSTTLERFAEAFAPCGFRSEAFYPCYGLAEGTLLVTGGAVTAAPRVESFAAVALAENLVTPARPGQAARDLVSCGRAWGRQEVVIVEPETARGCGEDRVGEIWVRGASVAHGYWDQPEASERDFGGCLLGSEDLADPDRFLKTGDLGFMHCGELFVTGRSKDLVILRGRNYYPQDLEATAQGAHELLQVDCGVAFSVEVRGEEKLVIAWELVRQARSATPSRIDAIAAAIRHAISEEHEVQVYEVVLLPVGGVPKTSSGKLRRRACRAAHLADELPVLGRSALAPPKRSVGELEDHRSGGPGTEGEALESYLRREVARAARVDESRVSREQPLSGLGLDSLVAVDLQHRLESRLGIPVSAAEILEGPSFAELAAELSRRGARRAVTVASDDDAELPPLTHGQEALWFLHRLAPESGAYHIAAAARVSPRLQTTALRHSLKALAERHPALRTTVREIDLEPRQCIVPGLEPGFREEEAAGWSEEEFEKQLEWEAYRPFDLATGPLFRVALFRCAETFDTVLLAAHHIIADFSSLAVLTRELGALYSEQLGGPPTRFPPLPLTCGEHARRERQTLDGPEGEVPRAYWQGELADLPAALDLPSDRPRPAVQTYDGALETLRWSGEQRRDVRALARSRGTTLFTVLLAAFQAVLHRHSGRNDLLVGSPTLGRGTADLTAMVGYFVNPVALRANLSGDPSFAELLTQVRRKVLGGLEHQGYPFRLLAESLQPERDPSRSPIFQVMFSLQQAQRDDEQALTAFTLGRSGVRMEVSDLTLKSLRLKQRFSQFDISLTVAELEGHLETALEYNTDLFDLTTARRLLGHYRILLEAACAGLEQRLSRLALLSRPEQAQLAVEWPSASPWRGGGAQQGQEFMVHELFEAQVLRAPDAIALLTLSTDASGTRLTYGELGLRVASLAAYLLRQGLAPEWPVGVWVERSAEMLVAVLAILKAGATYVPLDPATPERRLAFILEDSGARMLLTQQHLVSSLPSGGEPAFGLAEGCVVSLDSQWDEISRSPSPAPRPALAESRAYLIYTSGSTGRPKGVAVSHRSLAAYNDDASRVYGIRSDDRVLQFASLSFDTSAEEIFPALTRGATLVLRDAEMLASTAEFLGRLEHQAITVLNLPTSFGHQLGADLDRDPTPLPAALRLVIFGGEKAQVGCWAPWRRSAGPEVALWNTYGPTETTVVATRFEYSASSTPTREIPIGRPIALARTYLVDRVLGNVATLATGELCVGGKGVARGYLGRPGLTAEKFIPDPFGRQPGRRLYKTGDLARYLPSSEIEYHGRVDHQVKLRGFRIEPGEIEATLSRHPALREVTVLARDDGPANRDDGGRCLVAYLVPRLEESRPATSELRAFVASRLPEYMVPAAFLFIEALPLTSSGKVDRRRLPKPKWDALAATGTYVAPRTPLEELIQGIWVELLGVEQISVQANFFELGGHSLIATQLISRLREALRIEVPLTSVFESPTLAGLAERIEVTLSPAGPPPIRPLERTAGVLAEPAVLSFAQERLWFLDQLEPGTAFYNIPVLWRLDGRLSIALFERAVNEIVRRHEILRTVFRQREDRPIQVVLPELNVPLPIIDTTALPPMTQHAEASRRLGQEIHQPFDLATGPLLRLSAVRLAEETWLIMTIHHAVFDGWSSRVFLLELAELYGAMATDRPPELSELPVHYADFSVWQRQWLDADVLETMMVYWRRQLDGLVNLELPLDRPRPPVEAFRGAHRPIRLGDDLVSGLEALGRRYDSTLFMVLLGAFKAMLGRASGQRDVAVGSPIANRGRLELENVIGFFANTLVLRTKLTENPTLEELLARARRTTLGAYAHQDLPFEKLVEELQPDRDLSRNPLFQVMLVLQNQPVEEVNLPGFHLEPIHIDLDIAKFDLTIFWSMYGEKFTGLLEYNTDLFDLTTALRMVRQYKVMLEAMVADPGQLLDDVCLLSPGQLHQLRCEWNDSAIPEIGCRPVHHVVEQQVERTPDTVAVTDGARQLSYRNLNDRANLLAHAMMDLGVGPEDLVGICVERSIEMGAGFLAVLKAGGAGVALDPAYPRPRLAKIIRDAGMSVLLSETHLLEHLPAHGGTNLRPKEVWKGPTKWTENPLTPVSLDNPIYAIYTSGSTGQPKGIAFTHRGFANLIEWQLRVGEARPVRTVQFAAFGFCVSFQEIFTSWCSGGTLVLASDMMRRDIDALAGFLESWGIERLHLPFAALKHLAESAASRDVLPTRLREVVSAGEQLQISPAVRRLFTRLPGCTLRNQYGASETHVVSDLALIGSPGDWAEIPPVGRPIANVSIHLIDVRFEPAAIGVAAALYTSGRCDARGYLNDPALTAEKFVPDPFSPRAGRRLYRTGDLARQLPSGETEYLGRIDSQVKVRGYRVELGEIESVLARRSEVRDVAVLAHDGDQVGTRLVAYVVSEAGADTSADASAAGDLPRTLRTAVAGTLPEYMVPSFFVLMDELPLNTNGKLDREALPVPEMARPDLETTYLMPRSSTERVLADIWAEVVGAEQVGVRDNFFDLGGHSLLATQTISRVRQAFGIELPLRRLFESPTIEDLAREIEARLVDNVDNEAPPPLVALAGDLSAKPLPLSFAQERLWVIDQLEPGSAAYNIAAAVDLLGQLDVSALAWSFSEIVRRHAILRTIFTQRGDQPVQIIGEPGEPTWPRVELTALPVARQSVEVRRLAREEEERPFDLRLGPLFRATLLRCSGEAHTVLVTMHHIVSDGWSVGVLLREVEALYKAFRAGRPSPLPELAVQYVDFAQWQRRWFRDEERLHVYSYWKRQLAGELPLLKLPVEAIEAGWPDHCGQRLVLPIPTDLSESLKEFSRGAGVTLFMTLLTGFKVLLHRYTQQEDMVIGSAVAGRTRLETEELIGFFVNMLVLRTDLSNNPRFRDLLNRVRQVAEEAFAHQDMPLDKLVSCLQTDRDVNRAPLFQVAFGLQQAWSDRLELPGLRGSVAESDSGPVRFDLTVWVLEGETDLQVAWSYRRKLFSSSRIEQLHRHFLGLLASAMRQPDARLHALKMRSEAERLRELDTKQAAAAAETRKFLSTRRRGVRLPVSTPRAHGDP